MASAFSYVALYHELTKGEDAFIAALKRGAA